MNWILLGFTVAGVHGVVLSLAFLSAWRRQRKFFLGLYVLFFSLTILYYVIYWYGSLELHPLVRWLMSGVSWLMPAAFYFCLKKEKLTVKSFVHILPWVAFTVYWILAANGVIPREQLSINAPYIGFLKVGLFAGYGLVARRLTRDSWLDRWLIWGFYSVTAGLALYWASLVFGFYTVNFDYLISAVFVLFTYAVTYLSQREFLQHQVTGKYASSSLTKEEGEHIVRKVHELMEREQSYRDQTFNLETLAAKLRVPKYRVSQALNTFSRQSFSEILNSYRIEEAREKLHSPACRHLKVEAIGEEVGFSNKVSFYKHFKKRYGMAPGEYQRSGRGSGRPPLRPARPAGQSDG